MQETQVWFLGQEDPLEEEMATRSSILAWKAPWAEKPGGLWSTGPQRVGHENTIGGPQQNLSKYRNFSPYCHRTFRVNSPSSHKVICGYLRIFPDSNPNFCLSPSFCQNNSLMDELKQWETISQCCALQRVIIFPKEIGILFLDQ